jgi:hypothetical protein
MILKGFDFVEFFAGVKASSLKLNLESNNKKFTVSHGLLKNYKIRGKERNYFGENLKIL